MADDLCSNGKATGTVSLRRILAVSWLSRAHLLSQLMAFQRGDTSKTMMSRTLSTSELARGVDFILQDMSRGLPDDLNKLQDFKVASFYYHVP